MTVEVSVKYSHGVRISIRINPSFDHTLISLTFDRSCLSHQWWNEQRSAGRNYLWLRKRTRKTVRRIRIRRIARETNVHRTNAFPFSEKNLDDWGTAVAAVALRLERTRRMGLTGEESLDLTRWWWRFLFEWSNRDYQRTSKRWIDRCSLPSEGEFRRVNPIAMKTPLAVCSSSQRFLNFSSPSPTRTELMNFVRCSSLQFFFLICLSREWKERVTSLDQAKAIGGDGSSNGETSSQSRVVINLLFVRAKEKISEVNRIQPRKKWIEFARWFMDRSNSISLSLSGWTCLSALGMTMFPIVTIVFDTFETVAKCSRKFGRTKKIWSVKWKRRRRRRRKECCLALGEQEHRRRIV